MEDKIMLKKIMEELEIYGLTIDDLTEEELSQLQEEIKFKEDGGFVLDGILSNPELFYRKSKSK